MLYKIYKYINMEIDKTSFVKHPVLCMYYEKSYFLFPETKTSSKTHIFSKLIFKNVNPVSLMKCLGKKEI